LFDGNYGARADGPTSLSTGTHRRTQRSNGILILDWHLNYIYAHRPGSFAQVDSFVWRKSPQNCHDELSPEAIFEESLRLVDRFLPREICHAINPFKFDTN
jgi:hypothetical protein